MRTDKSACDLRRAAAACRRSQADLSVRIISTVINTSYDMTTESLQIPRGKHKVSNPSAVGIIHWMGKKAVMR